MAKATPVAIDPDEPFGDAARRVLAVRADEFMHYIPLAIEGDDIEHLHDLRVAGRRLRAVLEVFEPAFPSGRFRRTLRDVKDAGDPLGEARDLDVQIEALERWLTAAGPSDRAGVRDLIAVLREEREQAYDAFRGPLAAFAEGSFRDDVDKLAR